MVEKIKDITNMDELENSQKLGEASDPYAVQVNAPIHLDMKFDWKEE